jgi:hypothetical protein
MSLDNFIPEIWSAALLVNLRDNLVYGQLANRDYQGDISAFGDTVRINNIGQVTVGNYTKNTDMTAAQTLDSAQSVLTIDQSKYFNFQIDDVDQAQQNPTVMSAAMTEAAYALARTADDFMASLYTDIANNVGSQASPVALTLPSAVTPVLAFDNLVSLEVQLDQNNVPDVSRWVVVPPFFLGLLELDQRFTSFGTPANVVNRTVGYNAIGQVSGLTVYKSNRVPVNGTVFKVISGHSMAWSFADQVSEVEAYRPHLRFADAMKGLHLYGGKVVRPEQLAILHCTRPTGI